MASKAKATVAFKREILEMVDEESHQHHETRSAIIEKALRVWQRHNLDKVLAEGYQAMAKEDQKEAEKRSRLFFKEILS